MEPSTIAISDCRDGARSVDVEEVRYKEAIFPVFRSNLILYTAPMPPR